MTTAHAGARPRAVADWTVQRRVYALAAATFTPRETEFFVLSGPADVFSAFWDTERRCAWNRGDVTE